MSVDRERLLNIARERGIEGEEAEALIDDIVAKFRLYDSGAHEAEERLERLMAVACTRRRAAALVAGLDPVHLREIIASLPPLTRRVLQLHAFEGLDANGVAQVMKVSPTYAATLIAESVAHAKRFIK